MSFGHRDAGLGRYEPPVHGTLNPDALHRQIGIPKGSGLLLRKNEQTAIEGSRRASASHDSAKAALQCTARASWAVHCSKRDEKSCSRSAAADPSAWRQ